MSKATATGMSTVLRLMPADLAVVITGAIISATTAGRMPLKIAVRVGLFLIASGVRKMAIIRMMIKEGRMVPNAAARLPFTPFNLSPITVLIFTARMPGIDCAMASKSRNSSCLIQWCFSTTSRWIMEIIAQPPPKVKLPILKKVENS